MLSTSVRSLMLSSLLVFVGTLWLSGCSKESMQKSASETDPALSMAYDTLSATYGSNAAEEQRKREEEQRKKEDAERIEKLSAYFTDPRDGQRYRTVEIGGRTWMAENLNYKKSGECSYKDTSKCGKYNWLYDGETAMEVCPSGWHLPTRQEWEALALAAGGRYEKGDSEGEVLWSGAGKKLKATSGWRDYEGKNSDGTDDFGFSALSDGSYWWTATDICENNRRNSAYYWYISHDSGDNIFIQDSRAKSYQFSVRCILDMAKSTAAKASNSNALIDKRDGKKYKTVVIGGKRWMAENLNYKPKTGKSWCYKNDSSYCGKYGRLYDWATAMDIKASYNNEDRGGGDVKRRGVCPAGWHLPTRAEWDSLGRKAGGKRLADNEYGTVDWDGAGRALKAEDSWYCYGNESGCDDCFGFSALLGGIRSGYCEISECREPDDLPDEFGDYFDDLGSTGFWWTSAEYNKKGGDFIYDDLPDVYIRVYRAYSREMELTDNKLSEVRMGREAGMSVRCVQD